MAAHLTLRRAIGTAAVVCAVGLATPSLAREIGVVAAAKQAIAGSPPAAAARQLRVGVRVVRDELIETQAAGSGQLVFDDQTALTVGPSSRLRLSRFVYDPDADVGSLGVGLAEGALRIIGGAATRSDEALIETPVATTGIRGGMAITVYAVEEGLTVVMLAGESVRVTSSAGEVRLRREGAVARVPAGGGAPVFVGIASADELRALYARFEPGPGAEGPDPREASLQDRGIDELGGQSRQRVATSGGEPSLLRGDALTPNALGGLTGPSDFTASGDPLSPSPFINIGP